MKMTLAILILTIPNFLLYGQYDRALGEKSYSHDDTTFFQGELINQIDSSGLKIGKWIELYYEDDWSDTLHLKDKQYMFKSYGSYKILYVKDTIPYFNGEKKDLGFVIEKGKLTQYFERKGNYISVKDGIWFFHTSLGNLGEIRKFNNGRLISRFLYEDSRLIETEKNYIKDDKRFSDTYRKNSDYVFRRLFFPGDGTIKTSYFPDCLLKPNKYYISFDATIGQTDTLQIEIYSNSNDTVQIDNIYCPLNQISILNSDLKKVDNAILPPNDSLKLFLLYTPERNSLVFETYLKVKTKESKCNYGLNIDIYSKAYDIHRKNIKTLKKIVLTESDKKYLYIRDLEWHTFVKIYESQKKDLKFKYLIPERGSKKVDLTGFEKGNYWMRLESGDNEYKVELIIE